MPSTLQTLLQNDPAAKAYFQSLPTDTQLALHANASQVQSIADLRRMTDAVVHRHAYSVIQTGEM